MDSTARNTSKFLPTTIKEMRALGWEQADIILFSGDAYVDHPSFGPAVIGRVLENAGFKVAIVPQPNWRDDLRDFKKLGEPRLFFAVSSGCMDSMVNHYTANIRLRSDDAYTPGGVSGYRPDYAVKVYSNIIKKLYPDIPLVIGGIEASLRRFTHYDYWSNSLKSSILIDSEADILVYGMGEKPIVEIAQRISRGESIYQLRDIPQIGYVDSNVEKYSKAKNTINLHSYNDCLKDKLKFGENFKLIESESNRMNAKCLVESVNDKCVVVNPPYPLPCTNEIDSWYDLPYTHLPHPRYKDKVIPAWEMIKFSVNIHRGCFGGCSFCTISAHQGRFISSRSEKSILDEIEKIKKLPGFKGYLSDIGGPSANMYRMQGKDLSICEKCKRQSCIFPSICNNLNSSHESTNQLYSKVRKVDGIKKAFIGSGVRYDLFIDKQSKAEQEYFESLCRYHVSGRLKVAPEHTSDRVLKMMRKPSFKLFHLLKQKFDEINHKFSLNQQLIPYFISSHPASTEQDMQNLADETKRLNFKLEQVQDFTPTPMTLASTIYYTGVDPYTGEKVYVARTKQEKQKQQSYFFWYKKDRTGLQHGKGNKKKN
ncbi:MAG: YgiQ family radical SAM protein [Bacteroidales bacterium]